MNRSLPRQSNRAVALALRAADTDRDNSPAIGIRTLPESKVTILTLPLNPPKSTPQKQTRCKRGHPLSGDNISINKKGERVCKACKHLHYLKHYRPSSELNPDL